MIEMISETESRDVLFASLYFHELFKKTLLEATPALITTKTQINIVVTLFAREPMNITALSKHTGLAREQVTRAVRVLSEKEVLSCEKRPDNRREVIVKLTTEGTKIIERQLDESRASLETYLENLSSSEIGELVSLSKRAISILKKTGFKPAVPESAS